MLNSTAIFIECRLDALECLMFQHILLKRCGFCCLFLHLFCLTESYLCPRVLKSWNAKSVCFLAVRQNAYLQIELKTKDNQKMLQVLKFFCSKLVLNFVNVKWPWKWLDYVFPSIIKHLLDFLKQFFHFNNINCLHYSKLSFN